MTDPQFTPEQLEQAKIQIDRVLCRKYFYHFVRQAWNVTYPSDPFVDGWHVAAICYHIQSLIDKKALTKDSDIADTMVINLPPGCGKSRLVSVLLSAWLWAREPCTGMWYASFGYNVLDRDALDARRLIDSDWFKIRFWDEAGIKLTDDQNQRRRYNNTAGGWRLAASIGSKSGFGEHPGVLCLDDPHDPEQALGEQRFIAIDAWDNKYSTRGIVKGVSKIVIAQRLGEGDLCGHILANEDDVVHCWIPMWYENDRHCKTDIEYHDIDDCDKDGMPKLKRGWSDPRKENGELMWPEMLGEKKVNTLKKRLRTSHMISAQLQQNPTSPEGDMFQAEWLSYADAPPTHGVAIRAWDKASTIKRKSDFTAGVLVVYDGEFFYICDVRRFKRERREREAEIMRVAIADEVIYPDYTLVFEQTPSSDGKDSSEMQGSVYMDRGFRVRIDKPSTNKVARAETLADMMSGGRVKIVNGEWTKKFISELLAFPNGAHDDQVDAASMAIRKAQKSIRFGKIRRPLLLLTDSEQQELAENEAPQDDFSKYLALTEPEEHNDLNVIW